MKEARQCVLIHLVAGTAWPLYYYVIIEFPQQRYKIGIMVIILRMRILKPKEIKNEIM